MSIKTAEAIGQYESGGNYNAIGPKTKKGNQAYGKYQIMDFNIPNWSKEAGVPTTTQEFLRNPKLQDKIARYKINQYWKRYKNVGDVASVWFSGQPIARAGNAKDVIGTSVPQYVRNVEAIYEKKENPLLKDFNIKVDKSRQMGLTDTEILDKLSKKDAELAEKIKRVREKYNDSDILNKLSVKFSGKTPTVQSVGLKDEETIKELENMVEEKAKKGLLSEDTKENWKRMFQEAGEEMSFKQAGQTGVEVIGRGITGIFEAGFNLFGKGVKAITPDIIENKVSEVMSQAGSKIMESKPEEQIGIKEGLKSSLELLAKGINKWGEWEKKHPDLIHTLEGVGGIASVLPVEKAGMTGLKGLSKIAKPTIQPIKKGIEKGVDITKKGAKEVVEKGEVITKYAVGQATGLKPKTITEIIEKPKLFTKEIMESVDRDSIAKNVKDKIDARLKALSTTGKGYNVIKKSDQFVEIPEGSGKKILEKYKLGLDEKGKIIQTVESIPLSSADKKALQDFINMYNTDKLSANAFLNARTALSNMAKYGEGKTSASKIMARELRSFYDDLGKTQIKGLKELDVSYSSEIEILSQIKKDYFTKTGEFKDGAVNKIANLGGIGKQKVLDRLKKITPDIEEQLNILKAIEDIEYASGRAVGTYARSIIGAGGILSSNIPMMAIAVVSTPKIAVIGLRKYAKARLISTKLVEATIKSMKDGVKLVGRQAELFKNFLKVNYDKFKKLMSGIKADERGFAKIPFAEETKPKIKIPERRKLADIVPDDLAVEARKYKSTEEFVEAQGKPVYHGTQAKFDTFKTNFSTDIEGKELGLGWGKGNFYFTTKKGEALKYATRERDITVAGKYPKGKPRVIEAVVDLKKPYNMENAKNYERWSDIRNGYASDSVSDVNWRKFKTTADKAEAFTKQLKKEGYDGIVDGQEITAFYEKSIKTKSQLIDIYNKATKPKKIVSKNEFKGLKDLTLKTVEKLKGKTTVSKQSISDLTNAPDLKQAERDLVRKILDDMPDGKINVQEFADKIKTELVPLDVRISGLKQISKTINKIEALEELKKGNPVSADFGGNIGRHFITQEDISKGVFDFQTPLHKTFLSKHRGIAILLKELRGNVKNYKEIIYESPIKTSAGDIHFSQITDNYFAHTRIEDMADGITRRVIEAQSDLFQKGRLQREITPNIMYDDVDKAIYKLSIFGWDKDKIPTIIKENVLDARAEKAILKRLSEKSEADIGEKGMEAIKELAKQAKKEGGFEKRFKEVDKLQPYRNTWHERIIKEEIKKASQDGKTKLQFPTGETAMKIEGLGVNTSSPIFRFYEKDIQKYLKRIHPEMERITDKQGVEWFQIQIKPEDAKLPIEAFGLGGLLLQEEE